MYKIILVLLLALPCFLSFSQSVEPPYKATKKGSMYIYWGWNRSVYSIPTFNFQEKIMILPCTMLRPKTTQHPLV